MISDVDVVCKRRLETYATIYKLDYTIRPDPGEFLHRYTINEMDVDLRLLNDELLLQFYGLKWGWVYVFKWTRSREKFGQILENIGNDLEQVIDVFISALTGRCSKNAYYAYKYGLK